MSSATEAAITPPEKQGACSKLFNPVPTPHFTKSNNTDIDPRAVVVSSTKTLWAVSFKLMFFPMIFLLAWLSIPLSRLDGTSDQLNAYLFLIPYHGIYNTVAIYFGFVLYGLAVPIPKKTVRIGISFAMGVLGIFLDVGLFILIQRRGLSIQYMRILIPCVTIFVTLCYLAFILWFLYVKTESHEKRQQRMASCSPWQKWVVRISQDYVDDDVKGDSDKDAKRRSSMLEMFQLSTMMEFDSKPFENSLKALDLNQQNPSQPTPAPMALLAPSTGPAFDPMQYLAADGMVGTGMYDSTRPNEPATPPPGIPAAQLASLNVKGVDRRSSIMVSVEMPKRRASTGRRRSLGDIGQIKRIDDDLLYQNRMRRAPQNPNTIPAPSTDGAVSEAAIKLLVPEESRRSSQTDGVVRQITPGGTVKKEEKAPDPRKRSRSVANNKGRKFSTLTLGSAAAYKEYKSHFKVEDESLDEFNAKQRSFFIYQLIRITFVAVLIIVVYYYCQVFTFFYDAATKRNKTILAAVFSWTLFPFNFAMGFLADAIDGANRAKEKDEFQHVSRHAYAATISKSTKAVSMGLTAIPSVRPLVYWVMMLFSYLFYRNLFSSINDFQTFFIVSSSQFGRELLLYPGRMTTVFGRLRRWFYKKIKCWSPSDDVYQTEICVEFYFVCMAQRVAAITYCAFLSMLVKLYNQKLYRFETQMDMQKLDDVLMFAGIMVALEWTCSTIIWAIIKYGFKKDVVLIGTQALVAACCLTPAVTVAIHVLQDVYLAQNCFKLQPLT